MLSPFVFVRAAECSEIAEERMGGVAVCSGCSSYTFFDMRGGEVPGGVWHSHSLVLSLISSKNTWQSALSASGVYSDAKGRGRSATQGISLGSL